MSQRSRGSSIWGRRSKRGSFKKRGSHPAKINRAEEDEGDLTRIIVGTSTSAHPRENPATETDISSQARKG